MKKEVIQFLKEQVEYVSGEEMSKALGVTRTSIWKMINKLKEEGYQIESSTKKGYKLVAVPNIITAEEISPLLNTHFMGRRIQHYDEISSTNEKAKEFARMGVEEGCLVIADKQLTGKGRLGRAWDSPAGTGIWMSLVIRPRVLPYEVSKLTLVAGLVMCKVLQEETNLEVLIKWPNDLVVNQKKVCGILAEMSAEMEGINYVILGIGVNVNTKSFPKDLPHATSLAAEGQQEYSRKHIIAKFLNYFEVAYQQYIKEKGLQFCIEEYRRSCITIGKTVRIQTREEEYEAFAKDIGEDGLLKIERDGQIEEIYAGEVSVRGLYGYV